MVKGKSAPKPLKKDLKAQKVETKKKDNSKSTKVVPPSPPRVQPPSPPKVTPKGKKGTSTKSVMIPKPPSPVKVTKRGVNVLKAPLSPPAKVTKTRNPPTPIPEPAKAVKTPDATLQKVIVKGGGAVDKLVPNIDDFRVYQDTSRIYSATLNQSNLDANNNKFYIIQILLNEKTGQYTVWNRWGRVGVPGQNSMKGPMTTIAAINEFSSKLHDKTKKGDYKELDIRVDDDEDNQKKPTVDLVKVAPKTGTSKLDQRVQNFINLIFDTGVINTAMKEIGYDPKKMPLGKLGDSTIKEAYKVLDSLAKAIKKSDRDSIKSLTSQFYTLIPHDFGFRKMIDFIIDTEQKLKQKLNMLADISDMKITTKLLASTNAVDDVVDQNYKKLGCSIEALDKKGKEFDLIKQYFDNTKQSYKIEVDDIYKISRPTEEKSYNAKMSNKMLLWHGSGIANFVGILSQGLRIAPPEAPASGYLFGKGIYLADMIGKSFGYCRSGGSSTALCLLIEGALGDPNILLNSNCSAKELMEQAKKHHTKCHGRTAPPESSYVKLDDVIIPTGKDVETKSGSYMGHNEYIVYNMSQAKIRYVVRMKMN